MPALKKLTNFLEKNRSKFEIVMHRKVYTTYDAAQTQHEDIKRVAKTLLVRIDRDIAFVIIPGHRKLDTNAIKKAVNKERKAAGEKAAKKVSLATEALIKSRITRQVGALVPFGSLYKIPTYWDKMLNKPTKILLNAGSFTETVEMTPAEYCRLEDPIEGNFSKAK